MIVYKLTRSDNTSIAHGLSDKDRLTYKIGKTTKPRKRAIYCFDSIESARHFAGSMWNYESKEYKLFKCEGIKSRGKMRIITRATHLRNYFIKKFIPEDAWGPPPKGTVIMKEVRVLEEIKNFKTEEE